MPLLGGRKNMMPDTKLKTPLLEGQKSGTNMNIEEDKIFSKGKTEKKEMTLEIETIPEEEEDTVPLLPEETVEAPVTEKKKKGRPKVSDERREEVRKERAARLVAGRAKSLEKRRENALKKKAEAGRIAQERLGQQYQKIPVPVQQPPAPVPVPVQQAPAPVPLATRPLPPTPVPVNNMFDYDKIINGVYSRMEQQSSSIDEQALLDYGDKIRAEEQAKAKQALQGEYEKINKVRGRYEQMNNAVNLLGHGANSYKPNHRVFGRRPGGSRAQNGRNNFGFQ